MTGDLRAAREFQAYLGVRDAVLRMRQRDADAGASRYWTEELEHIDYLIDASPLVVRKLRQHAFHVTNVRPYDYRDKGDGRREHFVARLRALQALDAAGLAVPESPALGGFGYDIDGRLYNVDTLKFYEVLIGMEAAGLLAPFRAGSRRTVCEIGAGWGGFAYQFKTLFPNTTYVIVDFPELFLFSATYLQSVFPEARVRFCGVGDADDPAAWREADFVFVPNTSAALVASAPLDLAVNMVSFQEMTDAQVREYAGLVAAARCPAIYSLNRDRSPYNTELTSVSAILGEQYELREIPVLETEYTTAMKKPPRRSAPASAASPRDAGRSALSYRHLAGTLRAARPGSDPYGARSRALGTRDLAPLGSDPTRVVLGMTLYNKARHLRESLDSLLAQTYTNFVLVMLDDGSDESDRIALEYAARDDRIRYFRHPSRRAMVATWREVVDLARAECPGASYFAWVSDHDRWHPEWLATLVRELDAHPGVVLAYSYTQRMDEDGRSFEKGPRLFDTFGLETPTGRWRHFCRHGVGCGDMVYGLIRLGALQRAGVFRRVSRPDRLLIAELVLQGQIRQVAEVLWYRRDSGETSVARQGTTLFLRGEEPPWFSSPPWLQHCRLLYREYVASGAPPVALPPAQMRRMILRYMLLYGWRHVRKTEASHAVIRGIENVIWTKKIVKRTYHHAVYYTLVGGRAAWGRTKRLGRRALYEVLMLTHRIGLRGRGDEGAAR